VVFDLPRFEKQLEILISPADTVDGTAITLSSLHLPKHHCIKAFHDQVDLIGVLQAPPAHFETLDRSTWSDDASTFRGYVQSFPLDE
jgi:hypothetical protein